MFGIVTYYKLIDRLLFSLLFIALSIRVSTQFYYGENYLNPAINQEWLSGVYYKGQSFFELSILFFSLVMVRRYFPRWCFIVVNFFLGLCLFQWVKDYFLDPYKWQVREETMFYVAIGWTVLEILISKNVKHKIFHYLKLLFR